ncbi:hypothetical protein JMN32_04535 [Fulvivirga sp. 29W222]|uniref:Translation initiation factor IF-2 N-terminal domain-containing protein n=1 Tax=Fulvivirga marina TaxID=2494733 RepID=A0A937KB41_9BACT|nr:hypothetical protein [Fulvivirga marina]MBL6445562.1 hypothetical protein [Fulvivirga marina]
MRLVQLSRELGITQSEIIEFLTNSGIKNIEGSNTKIDDHAITLVMQHFGKPNIAEAEEADQPRTSDAVQTMNPVETNEGEPNQMVSQESNTVYEENQLEEVVSLEENMADESADSDQNEAGGNSDSPHKVEVIRAKKIKLEGIKVLGKIKLPEPVKKEKEEVNEKPVIEKKHPKKRSFQDKNGKKPHRKSKREESYEQKQKRQEREALKKKKEREKKLKEKKKAHYEQQVKPGLNKQKPSAKPKKKKTSEAPIEKEEVIHYKNPIKKFWAWLNGKYD